MLIDFVLVTGDPNKDFLEQNPELVFFPFVQKLQNDLLLQNKVNGVLWSLYMVEDPKSKIYYGISYDERISMAEKKYGVNYMDDCMPFKDDYINACMGPHERNYKRLNDKFQKMIGAIENSELNDSVDFFAKITSMYKGLEQVESKYVGELESIAQKYKGDRKPGGLFQKREQQ